MKCNKAFIGCGFAVLLGWSACRKPAESKPKVSMESVREPMIRVNQNMNRKEREDIDAYIRRYDLKMRESGTGLRYLIINEGRLPKAQPENQVKVNYKVWLLNGRLCYSSDSTGAESFVVDHDDVESGLHEGIKMLGTGGKAKFILPSHLAHGLIGDDGKIPARSPVVYDIEVLSIHP